MNHTVRFEKFVVVFFLDTNSWLMVILRDSEWFTVIAKQKRSSSKIFFCCLRYNRKYVEWRIQQKNGWFNTKQREWLRIFQTFKGSQICEETKLYTFSFMVSWTKKGVRLIFFGRKWYQEKDFELDTVVLAFGNFGIVKVKKLMKKFQTLIKFPSVHREFCLSRQPIFLKAIDQQCLQECLLHWRYYLNQIIILWYDKTKFCACLFIFFIYRILTRLTMISLMKHIHFHMRLTKIFF